MAMTLILIVLLLAVCVVGLGHRSAAIYIFTISFIMAVATFIHHMTDAIGLSL